MDKTISLEKALELREQGAIFIDARSPAEFEHTSIPGAINVSVLDDEERATVGTLYKEQGQAAAKELGVEIVAPKIPAMIRQIREATGKSRQPVVVFCWRGGMRSKALTEFLGLAGIRARQLVGGHKAFRAHVREYFETASWGRMLVLRGLTGVGKTRILHRLEEEGYPVLDLEGLAIHRGSAFGGLGLQPQPSQKQFEALLWDKLHNGSPQGYFLTEGESRSIGKVKQPPRLYESLQTETSLWLSASLDFRTEVILEDYPASDELKAAFVAPIEALKRRLGKETVERFLGLLETGKWRQLVRELMEHYYDPLYAHTEPQRRIEIELEPLEEGMERLREAIETVLKEPSPKDE